MSMLSVRVWRGGGAAAGGRFVAYDVPRHPAQTVLDVVTHIQRRIDPTLAYRFACRVGMCGSCAMTRQRHARAGRAARTSKPWPRTAPRDRAAREPAGDSRSRHRHARVLRQVGAREGAVRADRDATRRIRDDRARRRRRGSRWTPRSSASAAASATRAAMSSAGIARTSVRRRSIARGRSSTTRATARDARAARRGRGRRGLPCLSHASELHRSLSEGARADRVDRRSQARDGLRGAQGRSVVSADRVSDGSRCCGSRSGRARRCSRSASSCISSR